MSKEDQDILFYAFRYALGRRTGVVSQMVSIILNRWEGIDTYNKGMMKNEILHAIGMRLAGDDCDIEEWEKILSKWAEENK